MKKNYIIMMIALSLIILVSSSYAYLKVSQPSNRNYTLKVGTLNVIFQSGQNEKLSLSNMYPMSDLDGKSNSEELSFTVKNTGNVGARYNVYLEETSTAPEFKSHIRYIIKKDNHDYTEPKVLSNNKYIDANAYLDSNGSSIYKVKMWLSEDSLNEYMSKEFKAKLVIESVQDTFEFDLYDMSGNDFNAKFMNGAKITTDQSGKKAISFDGNDDFVDIGDLPATVDFANGFTVEFEAVWKALNTWSRIFDFGNAVLADTGSLGNENIFVANAGTTNGLNFDARYGNTSKGSTTLTNAIELNKTVKFKIVLTKKEKSYDVEIYKDGILSITKTYEVTEFIKNILRTENFLGKSNWPADKYFNGLIYNLKITDSKGSPIIWYDLNW